jgi:hypothetical protein
LAACACKLYIIGLSVRRVTTVFKVINFINTTTNTLNVHHLQSTRKAATDISAQSVRVRVRVTLQLTVSQSVSLGVEPNLELLTRDYLFFKVTVLSFAGALSDERSGLSFVNIV